MHSRQAAPQNPSPCPSLLYGILQLLQEFPNDPLTVSVSFVLFIPQVTWGTLGNGGLKWPNMKGVQGDYRGESKGLAFDLPLLGNQLTVPVADAAS